MTAAIPPALKAADIARFAQRAGQLEKAEPVVAYWCNYYIVEQIIAKGLHQRDDDSKSYTLNLMDKLEQTKLDFSENDAITDDMAGQAYVEQFGLKTFLRAENAIKADKASRQTADTFQASATFLDLSQIWGPLEPEVASKIKYAKYHALRIAKALKAGEDPNLSNPVPEPEPPALDPNDPDVQMLNGDGDTAHNSNARRQPSVLEIPDEHDLLQGHLAQQSTHDESLHPSRAPSVPPQPRQETPPQQPEEDYYHTSAQPDVSPLDPSANDRDQSERGGYFPRVPENDSNLPDVPGEDPGSPPVVGLPGVSSLPRPSSLPPPSNSLHSFPPPSMDERGISPPPTALGPTFQSAVTPTVASAHRNQPLPTTTRVAPQTPIQPQLPTPNAPIRHAAPSRPAAPPAVDSQTSYVADEEAILKAQKHARWAISALNFEDVNTAVKELRGALATLGAR